MTDDELAAIVQRRCDYEATVDDIDALVAEVRRLRGELAKAEEEFDRHKQGCW